MKEPPLEDWLELLDAVQRLIRGDGCNPTTRNAFVGEFASGSPKPNSDEKPGDG